MLFHSIMMTVNALAWAFLSILVYKETNSFSAILTAHLAQYTGLIISFGMTTFFLDRIGYLKGYRLTMLVQAAVAFGFMLSLEHFGSIFLFLFFFQGIGQGSFWPLKHAFIVKEVHGYSRTYAINVVKSIELFIGVFVPILAGALIAFTENYVATFAVAAVLYLLAAIYPFKFNKQSESKITSGEITRILKRKHAGKFFFLMFSNSAVTAIIAITMTILPFIFLGSEFEVGILASAVGFVAAISAFWEKDFTEKRRIKLANLSWAGYAISNILFAIIWTTPLLVFRSLVVPFLQALGISSRDNVDANIREKVLGEFNDESALEMNLIVESVYYIGRVFIIIWMLLLLEVSGDSIDMFLRGVVFIAPLTLAILYNLFVKINRMLKIF